MLAFVAHRLCRIGHTLENRVLRLQNAPREFFLAGASISAEILARIDGRVDGELALPQREGARLVGARIRRQRNGRRDVEIVGGGGDRRVAWRRRRRADDLTGGSGGQTEEKSDDDCRLHADHFVCVTIRG